jgi:hypothetical protein
MELTFFKFFNSDLYYINNLLCITTFQITIFILIYLTLSAITLILNQDIIIDTSMTISDIFTRKTILRAFRANFVYWI